MTNFASILDDQPTEVSAPPTIPVGTYLCTVGPARYDKSSKKGTPFIEHPLHLVQALDDVNEEHLAEVGGVGGKIIPATFYYVEGDSKSLWRYDQFQEACGVDLSQPASRRARAEAIENAEVIVYFKHEPSEDGSRTYARPSKFMSAN